MANKDEYNVHVGLITRNHNLANNALIAVHNAAARMMYYVGL